MAEMAVLVATIVEIDRSILWSSVARLMVDSNLLVNSDLGHLD
jgi:hypothetical protein